MQSAFSYSALEKLPETHGFLIYELLTPDDIQRDGIDRGGAALKVFEHVNSCIAVRKNEVYRGVEPVEAIMQAAGLCG